MLPRVHSVYVIINSHKEIYVGLTNNLSRRLEEHRSGKCISTRLPQKKDKDWKYFHKWSKLTHPEAAKLEAYLHTMSDAGVLALVLTSPDFNKVLQEKISTIPMPAREFQRHHYNTVRSLYGKA